MFWRFYLTDDPGVTIFTYPATERDEEHPPIKAVSLAVRHAMTLEEGLPAWEVDCVEYGLRSFSLTVYTDEHYLNMNGTVLRWDLMQ